MKRGNRTRWWSALGLAVLLSAGLLAAACTDDDSSATATGDGSATATVAAPALPAAGGLGAADVAAGTEFAATNGLFAVRYPRGWIAEQHGDGGGVAIGSSPAALDADTGSPPPAALVFNLTFLPATLFRLIEVDPDSPTQAVARLLTPTDGSDPPAPEIVELEGGRVVAELRASGGAVDGAVYVFDAAPGVFGVVSARAAADGYEPMRALVLAMLDSLEFSGTAERLIEVLGPPPSTPGVFG